MAIFNGLNSNNSTFIFILRRFTTESLGVLGTLSIDLTMKPPSGFEAANPGLVIDKQLIHYFFIITMQCITYLK